MENKEVIASLINDEIFQLKLGNVVEIGTEYERFKENIQPRKRGRNISILNSSLRAQTDPQLKLQLIDTKRIMIKAIEEYQGDDPLCPWIKYINWVDQAFPSGGDYSGLVELYENCVRSFWNVSRYKEDRRYLQIWLDYASYCMDAEVIYKFLDAHGIGQSHEIFYCSYALHMEEKNNLREADSIFNVGLARKAEPFDKLKFVYRLFLHRLIMRNAPEVEEESSETNNVPVRCFGTALEQNANLSASHLLQRVDVNIGKPSLIYLDENSVPSGQKDAAPKSVTTNHQKLSSYNLSSEAKLTKENYPMPTEWNLSKVFPRTSAVPAQSAPTNLAVEFYADKECRVVQKSGKEMKLKPRKEGNKRETELLRENPLRNFPAEALDYKSSGLLLA